MHSLLKCLPTVPSGSVTNLNARDILSTSVELSWGPVNARDQNGVILSYNIYYRLQESNLYTRQFGVTGRVSDNSTYQTNSELEIRIRNWSAIN